MKTLLARALVGCAAGLLIFPGAGASAEELAPAVAYPQIPKEASGPAGFVPEGWLLEMESRGDLNGDSAPDLLLVLRMNDPKNVLRNEGPGSPELDTNPNLLVVAFATQGKESYSLVLADSGLIPRHEDWYKEPPFENAAIVNGTVQVSLRLFMTAGGWYAADTRLTFRYQDACFKLIGYDSSVLKRNTGKIESVSLNYLTRKAKISKGDLENEATEVAWKSLRPSPLLCLAAVGDGLDFEPEFRPFP